MTDHDHHHDAAEIDRHVRTYLIVFGSLMVLTLATVGAYALHLPHVPAIVLALFIAAIKASLVACFFMHLISEKRMIHGFLALTVIFFVVLLFVPILTSMADQAAS